MSVVNKFGIRSYEIICAIRFYLSTTTIIDLIDTIYFGNGKFCNQKLTSIR